MMVNLRDRERERTCVSCWLFGFNFREVECISAMSLVYGIMCVFYYCMFSSRIIIDCFT